MTSRIHPTALVEPGVEIGPGTSVWDNVHIRGPAWIGPDCIVGEKTYIAYGVRIGTCVKINAQVYVCTGVTIEDRVMIAAGVIFTNDRYPRAFAIDGDGLASSEPNEDTVPVCAAAPAPSKAARHAERQATTRTPTRMRVARTLRGYAPQTWVSSPVTCAGA